MGSGKPAVDAGGGAVDWGDGNKIGIAFGSGTYTHVYSKPGNYVVTASQGRQFKWNADDGSCSFICRAQTNVALGVRQQLTAAQISQLLMMDKSPQAKKDLATQQKLLQKLKEKQ